jgi:hypothetical protein
MYNCASEVIATDLQHELILLDPRNGQMFSLNETGRRIWHELPVESPRDLAVVLNAEFDVTTERALADVQNILTAMIEAGLIDYADNS